MSKELELEKVKDSDTLENELASVYSEFVKNLDKWLRLVILKGDTDKDLTKTVKESIKRNIKSNIDFYRSLALTLDKEGKSKDASQYKQLEKAYQAICKM
jgi:hypothetical protein